MKPCTIPFDLPFSEITSVKGTAVGIEIRARMFRLPGICPQCAQLSDDIHGYYERTLLDLPIAQLSVRIKLCVRRYRCQTSSCAQQTFGQRLPGFVEPYQRLSNRLLTRLYHIAQATSGQAGARLAGKLAMPTSGSTLLRIVRRYPESGRELPRVLGVDDWAIRKGRCFGTILVDLERHRVVDLLPDRTAATLKEWLQTQSDVEWVARDRSLEYALGISQGAPRAVQVTDRWHLLKNLGEAAERALQELYPRLKERVTDDQTSAAAGSGALRGNFPRREADERARQERRLKRIKRYELIRYLSVSGLSQQRIASLLNISRGTVIRYARAETFPERESGSRRASILDPHLLYLESRYQAGCNDARQLWREILRQGYPGSPSQVRKWMQWRRKQPRERVLEAPATKAVPSAIVLLPSAKALTRLLIRRPATLAADDHRLRQHLCTIPEIATVETLVRTFQDIVRERLPEMLENWLSQCRGSRIDTFVHFADSLAQDGSAVRAALETNWSNGQTEGQVNRLKLLKRQMYGRANLDLLRRRVLYQA